MSWLACRLGGLRPVGPLTCLILFSSPCLSLARSCSIGSFLPRRPSTSRADLRWSEVDFLPCSWPIRSVRALFFSATWIEPSDAVRSLRFSSPLAAAAAAAYLRPSSPPPAACPFATRMSIVCGVPILESVYCLACVGWAWKRCLHTGIRDSETWGLAASVEFEPVPRLCRMIMAVYEEDLENPSPVAPPGGYGVDPRCVRRRKNYRQTKGQAPPYLIYVDHENADIVLAMRGLNLGKESDYALLLDNSLGKKEINGGFVHNGLLKAAAWVLDAESEILVELLDEHPHYRLTFAGHSLGSGVAAMLAMLVVQNRERLGNIERRRVRCYAIAPARCMSLSLAVEYADVINSIVLQDDFLPRTATPLEDIFKSIFCLPCLLCLRCVRDTCIAEEDMFRDPRRLYAPGRMYHIVERKPFRFGKFPPIVRTAVPVDGRFEHLVPSCNATADHAIVCIESESRKALDLMKEKERAVEIPAEQKMERRESIAREHKEEHRVALRRAVTLAVPHAFSPPAYGTFEGVSGEAAEESSSPGGKESWNELIERLFVKDETGLMALRKSAAPRPE